MTSPATIYLAGATTVIAALGVGFGTAMVVTNTQSVHKEPAAGFAKRDQPVLTETPVVASVVAAAAPSTSAPPPAPLASQITPALTSYPEKVVGLEFAPPQPAPAAVLPNPAPEPVVTPSKPVVAPDTAESIHATSEKHESKKVKRQKTEKKVLVADRSREPRKQYADRRRPAVVMEQDDDDDEPRLSRTSFASDREERGRHGFFGFLFGD